MYDKFYIKQRKAFLSSCDGRVIVKRLPKAAILKYFAQICRDDDDANAMMLLVISFFAVARAEKIFHRCKLEDRMKIALTNGIPRQDPMVMQAFYLLGLHSSS